MTSPKIFEEMGRLKQQVAHLTEELTALTQRNGVLDRANEQVHEDLAAATRTVATAQREKAELVSDLRRLNEVVEAQRAEIESLKDQVTRQQKTIKVQSDQIASPGEGRRSRGGAFGHPPPPFPSFSQPGPLQPRSAGESTGRKVVPTTPEASWTKSSGNSWSDSAPRRDPRTPTQPQQQKPTSDSTPRSRTPQTVHRVSGMQAPAEQQSRPHLDSPMPIRQARQSPGSQGALVRQPVSETADVRVMRELSPFFQAAESWCARHCSQPDKHRDGKIPGPLRDRLLHHTNPDLVLTLLSSRSTRYLAITKIIIHEAARKCFRPSVVNGFRADVDTRLASLRVQHLADQPIHVQRGLVTATSDAVREITQMDGFGAWFESRTREVATDSFSLLEPLFNANVARSEAWAEIRGLWQRAFRIGLLMQQKVANYQVDFPPVGPTSHFNPAYMVNRSDDEKWRGISTGELGRRGVKLKLAFTPTVMEHDMSGSEAVSRYLHFANVLLE